MEIFTRGNFLIFLIFSLSFPSFAKEESWEDLNKNVIKLYNEGKYGEAIDIARKALEVAEKTYG